MLKFPAFCMLAALIGAPALAEEPPKTEVKEMSGIAILGNQEAPKALVIVPWKSSEIGNGIGLSSSLNDRPLPVDKSVFGRQVRYYEIRSGITRK